MVSTINIRRTNGQSRRIIPFTAWTMTYPIMVAMSGFMLMLTLIGTPPTRVKPANEPAPQLMAKVVIPSTMATVVTTPIAITASYSAPAAPTPSYAPPEQASVTVLGTSAAMQFIFQHESGGRLDAVNEIGACGLGQSLPCSKLANVCPNWRTDAACQIQFFTSYAVGRYGSWENAQTAWLSKHWW